MRNFQQLAAGVNVGPLLHQVVLHPELWNRETLRTAHPGSPHQAADDILLRFQIDDASLSMRFAACGGPSLGLIDDPECNWFAAWKTLSEASEIVFNLARVVKAERIGRVLITRLAPGAAIAPHEDGGAVASYYTRYQVALQSEPGCVFDCGFEQMQMRAGEVWWFDNKLMHSVVNNSANDRLVMIVDLKTS